MFLESLSPNCVIEFIFSGTTAIFQNIALYPFQEIAPNMEPNIGPNIGPNINPDIKPNIELNIEPCQTNSFMYPPKIYIQRPYVSQCAIL